MLKNTKKSIFHTSQLIHCKMSCLNFLLYKETWFAELKKNSLFRLHLNVNCKLIFLKLNVPYLAAMNEIPGSWVASAKVCSVAQTPATHVVSVDRKPETLH